MSRSVPPDPSRWQRVNRLLEEALALPPEQRAAWLDGRPAEDQDVVPTVRSALAREARPQDGFMSRPAASLWGTGAGAEEAPGQVIGPYRLVRELGTGGMGTVWLAERIDGALQRQVALKLPLYGWAPGVAERLEQERDALAGLEHPNVARLYDAGATPAGRPYLALEFVDGLPIDVYAREHGLSVRARLRLFLQVARAVAYAHGRLVVHRDLKPSNILVTHSGEVRLLDFGAAKLLSDGVQGDSALTSLMGRALSPDYAAPEQIRGETITVGSDVYSLGIVLFELLTGRRPYSLQGQRSAGLEAAVLSATVPRASSAVAGDRALARELRGDLDNILAKALKKDADERYGTVAAFADDLRRWLEHEPVSARRDSIAYRSAKFVQRHRASVAMGVLAIAALAAATVVTTVELYEARHQRDLARAQAKHAEAAERFADMVMEQSGPGGRPLSHEEMIDRSVALLDEQYADDPRFIAQTLIPIAGRYMDIGLTAKELGALEKAEAIARRIRDPLLLAQVECGTVETELARGRLDRAEARLAEADRLLAAAPNPPVERRIDCLHARATLEDARGNRGASLRNIEAALALQRDADPTDRTYRALLSHAQQLYLHAGRPSDALRVGDETLAVLRATDARNDEARSGTLHNEAVALYQMGEVSAALARAREVASISTGDDPTRPIRAETATVIGRLLVSLERAAEGRPWIERALADARGRGNVAVEVHALAALAEAEAGAARAREAQAALDAAAQLLTAESPARLRIVVARARTGVALRQHDAARAATAADELLHELGYPDLARVRAGQSADVYLLLAARAALESGHATEAGRLAGDALATTLALARDPAASATVGEARFLLARARATAGQREAAREAIRGAAAALARGLTPEHPLTRAAARFEQSL